MFSVVTFADSTFSPIFLRRVPERKPRTESQPARRLGRARPCKARRGVPLSRPTGWARNRPSDALVTGRQECSIEGFDLQDFVRQRRRISSVTTVESERELLFL